MKRTELALALVAIAVASSAAPAWAQYQLRDPSAGTPSDGESAEDEDEELEEELDEEEAADEAAASVDEDEAQAPAAEAASSGDAADEASEEADDETTPRAEAANPSEGHTVHFGPPAAPARAEGDYDFSLPPLLQFQRSGGATTSAVFPLFYLREANDGSELIVPPVYHREGREPFDVVFPLFWWFRGPQHHTWIAGPVWHHEDPTSHDVGVAPLFMSGRHEQRYYHILPPLLTAAWGGEDEDYLSAGLLGYRFRNHEDERWGLFPLLWVHDSPTEQYQFVPPLFFRWRNPEMNRTLTVLGPVYYQEDRAESFFGFAGLLHHDEGPNFHSTTIPPLLFHWSESPEAMALSTPLFLYTRDTQSETLVSWFYQRYRGTTEMDGVLPLFMNIRDPRDHSETLMASPLVWHWNNPASDNWLVAPLYLRLHERGRSRLWATPLVANFVNEETHDETTWIAPTIQVSRWHDGDAVNVHPLWYYESVPSHRFTVLNPLWWDFEQHEQHSRYTVAFPFYYRVVEGITESQVTLPLFSYFRRREWVHEGRWEWEIHLGGLVDYGERSDGESWWRVLYGLAGYEHRIGHDRLWLFYLPIDFANSAVARRAVPPDEAPATPAEAASEEAQLGVQLELGRF